MKLIIGGKFEDYRGILLFNNEFDFSEVKRMYVIQNDANLTKRGWQGHAVEKRWYACTHGKFKITLIEVDNWDCPSGNLPKQEFIIDSSTGLNILYIEPGCISLIESLLVGSQLLVFANYKIGDVNDEYRFPIENF